MSIAVIQGAPNDSCLTSDLGNVHDSHLFFQIWFIHEGKNPPPPGVHLWGDKSSFHTASLKEGKQYMHVNTYIA